MNLKNLTILAFVSASIAACTNAAAASIDPSDDAHCSVLAFYFMGRANHQGAPANQQRATKVMHEWYAARIRDVAVQRWGNMEGFNREVGPILETIKRDPASMTDDLMACTDRAIRNKRFDSFARSISS